MTWKHSLDECLKHWDGSYLVSSPDVDGLLSASILGKVSGARLIGLYTTRHLLLFDQFMPKDALHALWIDHDINHKSIQCIGQHLVMHSGVDRLPTRHPFCFNPNAHYGQTWRESFGGIHSKSQDKYPFATCHMFLSFFGLDTSSLNHREKALLAHADGTFANIHNYARNCAIWKDLMFPQSPLFLEIMPDYSGALDIVREHTNLVEELVQAGINKRSSQTSQRDIPDLLIELTGHQNVPYQKGQKLSTFLEKFNAVAAVISNGTQFSTRPVREIKHSVSGNYERMFPNQIIQGEFDYFLKERKIFSHAFTANSELRYTTMPNTVLEVP
ncbi:MAG: hypothetical protein OXL96_01085 [Candidatus Poribacteria bacterium]|nr:hypothetical protein [Candidatus Poribacteria bacterium]